MRVLVTGGAGLVGSALLAAAPPGWDVHATWRHRPADGPNLHRIDLADAAATAALLGRLRPDVVVHTAYGSGSQDVLDRDVVAATAAIAAACRDVGATLIHLSSDVVFDGEHAPYRERDAVAPVHAYGRAKAEAERIVTASVPDPAVVRTSLVVRADPPDPASARLLDGIRSGRPMTLFTDELRMPIAVEDLAAGIWSIAVLAPSERAGAWHLAGPEALSRYALGLLVAARAGRAVLLPTARSADRPERRPRDLRLSTGRADAALPIRPRGISAVLASP